MFSSPLSVKVIALWYFVASFLTFRTRSSDALVLGYYVSGRWAAIHNLILLVFLLALGIGLWLRRNLTRKVAIGYEGYLLLNELLALVIPSSRAYRIALINQVGVEPPLTAEWVLTLTAVPEVLFASFIIWFLVTRKSAFI